MGVVHILRNYRGERWGFLNDYASVITEGEGGVSK